MIEQAGAFLLRHKRVSLRAIRREFGLDASLLEELIDELVSVQRVAVLEEIGDVPRFPSPPLNSSGFN